MITGLKQPPPSQAANGLSDTLERITRLIERQRWYIIVTMVFVTLAFIGALYQLPNTYMSEATLVAVQPAVSARLVTPAASTGAAEAFQSLQRQLLSRDRLFDIITRLNLYPAQRAKGASPEALVDLMRSKIDFETLDPVRARNDFNTFKIEFTSDNPWIAQRATVELAALFINEDAKLRETQAATTTEFFAREVTDSKRKLDEQEQRLRDFKTRYGGELPEQEQANFQTLTELRVQQQANANAQSQAKTQRALLESTLQGIVGRLRSERDTLLSRFTNRHPDVVHKEEELAKMERLLYNLQNGVHSVDRAAGVGGPDDANTLQLRTQIETYLATSDNLAREERRISSEISRYQSRLSLAPIRQQELASILRDSEHYRQQYSDLQTRQLQSRLANNVEQSRDGQQFRLVDQPSFPRAPIGPPRLKLSFGGIFGGLALGLAIAFLREARDTSFHSEKAIRAAFPFPLVIGVPHFFSPREASRRRGFKLIEWSLGFVILTVVLLTELYVFKKG